VTEPDPVAAFERGLLKRRAWGGVLLIGAGIGMLLLGGVLLLWTGRGKFGYHPPIRIAAALLVLGVGAVAYSFRVFRGGYIDENNQWIEQARVPWRMVATYGALFALAVVAIAGWPLGFYDRAPDTSRCRELLPVDELAAIAGTPLEVQFSAGGRRCGARYMASGKYLATVEVEHDIADGYRGWIDDELSRARDSGPLETPLGFADQGVIVRSKHDTRIALRVGSSGARIGLGPEFDDARVAQVIDKLRIHLSTLGE